MKLSSSRVLYSLLTSLCVLLFTQCSSSSSADGYGPFDKNGNYVEAWADKKGSKKKISSSERKKIEEEAREAEKRFREIERENKKKKTVKAKEYKYQPKKEVKQAKKKAVVSTTYQKPKAKASQSTYTKKKPTYNKPKPTQTTYTKKKPVYKPKPKPRVTPKAKPKPKPVVVKAAPKFRWHFVRKGETLWAVSQKYGKSVSSIQRLNGMKGTSIWAGKRIKIPR